jgi:N-acetylmuramate 1-kinase
MSIPEQTIAAFLAASGLAGARRTALPSDASFRAYERVFRDKTTCILMKAPPGKEDTRPFAALADFLVGHGFSAPKVLARDTAAGLLLLEDLGDDLFTVLLKKNPAQEAEVCGAAIDVLLALHEIAPPATLPLSGEAPYRLKPYDEGLLFQELALFSDWYLPAIGLTQAASVRTGLEARFQPLIAEVSRAETVLTLRDYHADNLMWLPGREGIRGVGLLDFQDAVAGHAAYDLVSLLQDARRPYNPELEARLLDRYLAAASRTRMPREAFVAAYQALGCLRNLKIIGIFTRLHRRDGKAAYPRMIPHVWSLAEANLAHPALASVKTLLAEAVPAAERRRFPA